MKRIWKIIIIWIFLLICISAYEEDREIYFTTISVEEDMKYLDSVIKTQNGVSDSVIDRVEAEIQKLPTKLWKQYFYDGGELKIVSESLSDSENNVVGSFSIINEVYMTITINEDYIEYSLCHEFSHYLYHLIDVNNYLGYQQMLTEKESLWRDLMSSNQYFYAESEYFAEVGKLYFREQIDPERYPKTVKFFDVLTEQYR